MRACTYLTVLGCLSESSSLLLSRLSGRLGRRGDVVTGARHSVGVLSDRGQIWVDSSVSEAGRWVAVVTLSRGSIELVFKGSHPTGVITEGGH